VGQFQKNDSEIYELFTVVPSVFMQKWIQWEWWWCWKWACTEVRNFMYNVCSWVPV